MFLKIEESEFKKVCVFPNESIGLRGRGDNDCAQPPQQSQIELTLFLISR